MHESETESVRKVLKGAKARVEKMALPCVLYKHKTVLSQQELVNYDLQIRQKTWKHTKTCARLLS